MSAVAYICTCRYGLFSITDKVQLLSCTIGVNAECACLVFFLRWATHCGPHCGYQRRHPLCLLFSCPHDLGGRAGTRERRRPARTGRCSRIHSARPGMMDSFPSSCLVIRPSSVGKEAISRNSTIYDFKPRNSIVPNRSVGSPPYYYSLIRPLAL
jgi:hypothetical protein